MNKNKKYLYDGVYVKRNSAYEYVLTVEYGKDQSQIIIMAMKTIRKFVDYVNLQNREKQK